MTHTTKIEALASHLLDGFLQLREKYELLEPMLFDRDVVDARGTGQRARGFNTLKHTLFIGCIQDIAKITSDEDRRAPSITNIVQCLNDERIRNELRERFAVWELPTDDASDDPMIVEALKRIEQREEAQRRVQFDELHAELMRLWTDVSSSSALRAFRKIRNKVSAHTEIRKVADKYQPIDIGSLGIKWGDIKAMIQPMQRLVELCGLLVRNASFAWDALDTQLATSSRAFWRPDATAA